MVRTARDMWGRDLSQMARDMWWRQGQLGGLAGDPAVISFLQAAGLSLIDANFIADYQPIDKTRLMQLINEGRNPYDALSIMYNGPYLPNVDPVPAASYRHPSYVPPVETYRAMILGGSSIPEILAAGSHQPPPATTTGTTTGTPTPPATTPTPPATAGHLPFGIPDTIAGIPTLYWVGGGLAAFLLLN